MRPFRVGCLLLLAFYLLMLVGCGTVGDYRIVEHQKCVQKSGSYVVCLNKEIYK